MAAMRHAPATALSCPRARDEWTASLSHEARHRNEVSARLRGCHDGLSTVSTDVPVFGMRASRELIKAKQGLWEWAPI